MRNLNEDQKKVLIGASLGAVGVGAFFLFIALKKEDKNSLPSDIVEAMENFACMLEKHNIKEPLSLIKNVEKKIEKNENNISGVLELVMSGIQLWKNLKK